MGMFSWICKGCDHELISDELVRLDDEEQVYDGYGGSWEGHSAPSAWHSRCYNAASEEQRHSDLPSDRAPNQGFGPSKLEFMPNFVESAPTSYVAIVSAYDGRRSLHYIYTCNNKLEDRDDYNRRYREEEEKIVVTDEDWKRRESKEEEQIWWKEYYDKIEAVVGKNPNHIAKTFASIEEAVTAVDTILNRDLSPDCLGCYHLIIEGCQKKARGSVYERSVDNYDDEYNELKEAKTEITYHYKAEVDESTKLQKLIIKNEKELDAAQKRFSDAEAKLKATIDHNNELLKKLSIVQEKSRCIG